MTHKRAVSIFHYQVGHTDGVSLEIDKWKSILDTTALVVEPQGSHQVIAFKLGERIIKIVAPALPKMEMGETIYLNFKQESLRFFDPESTIAIGD